MASGFASTTGKQILSIKQVTLPKKYKNSNKFGLILFNGKYFGLSKLKTLSHVLLSARKRSSRGEISTFYGLHLLLYR